MTPALSMTLVLSDGVGVGGAGGPFLRKWGGMAFMMGLPERDEAVPSWRGGRMLEGLDVDVGGGSVDEGGGGGGGGLMKRGTTGGRRGRCRSELG
jgi:hypothetical protein